MTLYRQGGAPLRLGRELGAGGEAKVYALEDAPNLAVKLYHALEKAPEEKLKAMLRNRPRDPIAKSGHVAIAWPQELVLDEKGKVAGFIMPLVPATRAVPLHQVYHPGSRRAAHGLSWRYMLRIAHNLAAAVAALHESGYVIGDLSDANVLVFDNAMVTLVDCDSVQLKQGRKVYRCTVGRAEFTPPELQGRDFARVVRTPDHDLFALAVLIFLLLMEGVSPFMGIYRGEGEPPGLQDNVRAGRSPYLGSRSLSPPAIAPPFDLLPRELRGMMRRALKRPFLRRRPSAKAWQQALRRAEAQLRQCNTGGCHVYGRHLKACPWCARQKALGFDAYPGPPPPGEVAEPARPQLIRFYRAFPLLTLALLLPAGAMGYLAAVGYVPWLGLAVTLALLIPAALRLPAPRYRRLTQLERSAQAALGTTFLAVLASIVAGSLLGQGSILEGDWLFLPSFWLLALLLWRRRRAAKKAPSEQKGGRRQAGH
jgi:hypothetical protein